MADKCSNSKCKCSACTCGSSCTCAVSKEVVCDPCKTATSTDEFTTPLEGSYCFSKKFPGATYEDICTRFKEAVLKCGFGFPPGAGDIHLHTVLKNKLDKNVRPYRMISFCNPKVGMTAIKIESGFGLLLPCQAVIMEDTDGVINVGIMDPRLHAHASATPEKHEEWATSAAQNVQKILEIL
eukprot:m.329865 g.329865  ORF g.329865 m.329865 type:complete len:182 (-) comp16574_c0_seq4:40-585(-)